MNEIRPYQRRVHFYETDRMDIVHHSNHIRWFEEARIDMMRQAGIVYGEMEQTGVGIPVLEMHAKYHSMVRFDEILDITVKMDKYNGIVMEVSYEVNDHDSGELRCTGSSKHCFLDIKGYPVSMKKKSPVYHEKFMQLLQK